MANEQEHTSDPAGPADTPPAENIGTVPVAADAPAEAGTPPEPNPGKSKKSPAAARGKKASTQPTPTPAEQIAAEEAERRDRSTAADDEIRRLREENARLKREADERAKGVPPVPEVAAAPFPTPASQAKRKPTAADTAHPDNPDNPARGPFRWEGTLVKGPNAKVDSPLAPVVTFRTDSPSEAEAREAYLRFAGIVTTEHRIQVRRVEG